MGHEPAVFADVVPQVVDRDACPHEVRVRENCKRRWLEVFVLAVAVVVAAMAVVAVVLMVAVMTPGGVDIKMGGPPRLAKRFCTEMYAYLVTNNRDTSDNKIVGRELPPGIWHRAAKFDFDSDESTGRPEHDGKRTRKQQHAKDWQHFFRMWNGNWGGPPQHFCQGCCRGPADTMQKMIETGNKVLFNRQAHDVTRQQ